MKAYQQDGRWLLDIQIGEQVITLDITNEVERARDDFIRGLFPVRRRG